MEIELGNWVNFITGQNGSGKSAILTALCVAFGCRAKSTERATKLSDFIKIGCSYALVHVEIRNQGDDAFKPETYGDVITIERRITHAARKKVSQRKEDVREIVEHFNIDVENPCVIMSQDKSREFLHSGNDRDKFKATLLEQVDDLLKNIRHELNGATELVKQLEKSIDPILKELKELQGKIKSMEHVEEISQQVLLLKKKLAWTWVYDVDKQLQEESSRIEKLKDRLAKCQNLIDQEHVKMEELGDRMSKKKAQIGSLMERTYEVRRKKEELQHSLSLATKERLELEEEHGRKTNYVQKMLKRVKLLEQQIQTLNEQQIRNTQVEEYEMEEKLKGLQDAVDRANVQCLRLKEEEDALSEHLTTAMDEFRKIASEIEDNEKKVLGIRNHIRDLHQHQRNKTLVHGDLWALAVDNAIGKLLNAFIVTDHKDSLLLRACAREANYNRLQIYIYDFSRPRLNIPNHMVPQTNHPTTISVLHSDNPTVVNVLVDMGQAERQVLVKDYEVGKAVAFDQRIPNLKEVYTLDGYRMFSRGSAQTILPPNRSVRAGRLCSSYDDQIKNLERDLLDIQAQAQRGHGKKRNVEEGLRSIQDKLQGAKRRRLDADRNLRSKKFALQDVEKSYAAEARVAAASTVDELQQEISKVQDEIQKKELLLEKFQVRINEAVTKANDLKISFENLCESAKVEIDAFDEAELKLRQIEENMRLAEAVLSSTILLITEFLFICPILIQSKIHYEGQLNKRVLPAIKEAEAQLQELQHNRKESYNKASIICPESEMEDLGGCSQSTPEQLSAQLSRLNQRLQHESQRCSESLDDLRVLYEKTERKILKKQQLYKAFRENICACQKSLELRQSKFERNATVLKRQLTWQYGLFSLHYYYMLVFRLTFPSVCLFKRNCGILSSNGYFLVGYYYNRFNGHLGKKGISGNIKLCYEKKTLSVEVKMPQDASSSNVRDTRGLSGGERSFSTLCFALALHEMTEAPFRAMDEFDVFMDAVSRKISLDTLVDFALQHGSQWIFITPHDISMVKQDERIKKQQMAAPRS
ncbi:hypothetical protein RJ640_001019 [Escallonia rubra]|uniref:RecF/RecN/SMC N-terminal domain-containing protein n=1 Tax=Escallonia rubra TaxID=112253 RepID=A0AA88UCJ4_9ASTE|nr:hypothetical protein RJ640_001019 [Escallonia rubra]